MAFLINCDNKGCMRSQAAQLDLTTGEVICMDCGLSIKNITVFAKNQLKSFGQTTKNAKKQQPYSVKCEHCSVTGQPIIKTNIFSCSSCHKELMQLSLPFKEMLKNMLGNESK